MIKKHNFKKKTYINNNNNNSDKKTTVTLTWIPKIGQKNKKEI